MRWLCWHPIIRTLLVLMPSTQLIGGDPQWERADPHTSLPSVRQVTQRVHHLLRAEATSRSTSRRVHHALQMIRLTRAIARDPRWKSSVKLRQKHRRLAGRLRTIKQQTQRNLRREQERPARIAIDHQVLAQLINAQPPPRRPPPAALGNAPDYGPLLVALIQDVISPSIWDVNGGSSTIVYYRPGRALVVRAPQATHDDIGPLLGQLRR